MHIEAAIAVAALGGDAIVVGASCSRIARLPRSALKYVRGKELATMVIVCDRETAEDTNAGGH